MQRMINQFLISLLVTSLLLQTVWAQNDYVAQVIPSIKEDGASHIIAFHSPSTDPSEFSAFLETAPKTISFIRFWELQNNHPPQEEAALDQQFEQAQFLFFENRCLEALVEYSRLWNRVFERDWLGKSREIFFRAAVNAATCEKAEPARDSWLRRAFAWAPDLKPSLGLDSKEIIQRFNRISTDMETVNVSLSSASRHFQILFWNGRKIILRDQRALSVPRGPVRFTLLSNSFAPRSWTGTVEKSPELSRERLAFIGGSCSSPDAGPAQNEIRKLSEEPTKFAVYFQPRCAKLWNGGEWSDFDIRKKLPPVFLPAANSAPDLSSFTREAETARPWYKSPWVWLGAIVITAGAYHWHQNQEQAEERRPRPTPLPRFP